MGCNGCNGDGAPGWWPATVGNWPAGRAQTIAHDVASDDSVGPVLGPYLGGGIVGTGLGAGNVAKVGGGWEPLAVHLAESPDLTLPYPPVRHDFHYDFSTPTMIFRRRDQDPNHRELGGLQGGALGML